MKIENLKLKIFLVILIGFTFLLFAKTAMAGGISLGVYPPIFQIDTTPPADIQAPLTIENQGDEELTLSVTLRPFEPSDQENGQVKYVTAQEANFIDPLIFERVKIFDPSTGSGQAVTQVTLSPKQKKNLTLLMQLPKDEPPSDYYFSVVFLSSAGSSSSNSSENQGGIATNVLLSIGPKGKVNGSIQEFSAPLFLDKGPVPFTVRVRNNNSFYLTTVGDILIKNMFGQSIARLDLPKTNVLANSVRDIPTIESGDYAYWNEKFLIGVYKASLTLALTDSGPIFRRDVYFFAFPSNILFPAVIAILILGYIMLRVRSRI